MAVLNGTSAVNTISGTSGADVLQGNGGNDRLYGKGGDDLYVFNLGDGKDTIYESSGSDTIEFGAGIDAADLDYQRSGNDLIISITGSSDTLTLKNFYLGTAYQPEIRKFYDGAGSIKSMIDDTTITGNSNSEKLYGTALEDYFIGNGGDDTLYGYDGDDTYYYTTSNGNDCIIDTEGTDTIEFDGVNDDDVTYKRDGYAIYSNLSSKNDLYLTINSGGQVRLPNYYANKNVIEELIFADGSDTFEDNIAGKGVLIADINNKNMLKGTTGNDGIKGGSGNDKIYGLAGNDEYIYLTGEGNDTIIDSAGSDTLYFANSLDITALSFKQSASDLIITTTDDSEITVSNWFSGDTNKIEYLLDASLHSLDVNDIFAGAAVDKGSGSTTISGSNLSDGLNSGTGDDTIYGKAGNDTYVYEYDPTNGQVSGDGKDVIYDISGNDTIYIKGDNVNAAHVSFEKINDSKDLKIQLRSNDVAAPPLLPTIADTDNYIIVKDWFVNSNNQIENIFLAGADITLNKEDIYLQDGFGITGTDGDDTIDGTDNTNIIISSKGQDTTNGGAGNDIYYYATTAGRSIITDTSGNDTIMFSSDYTAADVAFTRSDKDLQVWAKDFAFPSNKKLAFIVENWFSNNSSKIENIVFANGDPSLNAAGILANITSYLGNSSSQNNDSFTGTSLNESFTGYGGNDILSGAGGNDNFHGGTGNDKLYGGSGDDCYYFSANDGSDTISDSSGDDLIECSTIASTAMTFTKSGNNLVLERVGSTDSMTILNYFLGADNKIESFNFSDETMDASQILNSIIASDQADILKVSNYNDTVIGDTGNDTIYGYGGNDLYQIGETHGIDYIYDTSGNDTVEFEYDREYNTLNISKSGYDLKINYLDLLGANTGDGAVIKNYFSNTNFHIETIWTEKGNAEYKPINTANMKVGSSAKDNFTGGTEDNFYFGNGGNDTIYDLGGNDSYYIKAGNSYITDKGGNDQYHYYAGTGNDTISISNAVGEYDEFIFYNLNPTNGFPCSIINNFDFKMDLSPTNSLIFKNWFTDPNNRIDNFVFYYDDNGTIKTNSYFGSVATDHTIHTLDGTSAHEKFTSDGFGDFTTNSSDECLIPGAGNDTIQGSAGNDRSYDINGDDWYSFAEGDGQDTITDLRGNDTLEFTSQTTIDNLEFTRIANDLLIDKIYYPSPDSITVKDWFLSTNNQIEKIIVGGTEYEAGTKLLVGTAGNNNLTGTSSAERFYGAAGNDTLTGNAGNDTLNGGSGNDIYKFGPGADVDIIDDSAGTDRINFQSGVDKAKIALLIDGSDLIVDYGTGTGDDEVTILGNNIEKLSLSSGKYLSLTDINNIISHMTSHTGDGQMPTNIQDAKSDSALMTWLAAQWHT